MDSAKEMASDAVDSTTETSTSIGEATTDVANTAIDATKEATTEIIETVKEQAVGAVDAAKDMANDTISQASEETATDAATEEKASSLLDETKGTMDSLTK
jgi:hypothetical protein